MAPCAATKIEPQSGRQALLVVMFQDRSTTSVPEAPWFSGAIRAMDLAPGAGVPVALIRQVTEIRPAAVMRPRDPLWGVHPEIVRRRWSILIDTCGGDFFLNPVLTSWLRRRRIQTVTLCGHIADLGGELTLTSARARRLGYTVQLLADTSRISRPELNMDRNADQHATTRSGG